MAAEFLPAQAPADVQCHQIDFTATDPPLPKYKDLFAAVIENFLTPAECEELIRQAEASTVTPTSTTPAWERAMINVGNGKQALATDTRNCGRIIWDSPEVAQKLLDRLMPFLRDFGLDRIDNQLRVTGLAGRRNVYHLTRLNERLRFLKYEGGEYFRPHWDGFYRTPDRQEQSLYTIQLYLSGAGDQDVQELKRQHERVLNGGEVNLDVSGELLGGATSFSPRYEDQDTRVRVFPKTGSMLVFQQNDLLHGGDPVFRGTKYTVRTDIMYRVHPKAQ